MSDHRTLKQEGEDLERTKALSVDRAGPPVQVPGYSPDQFIGSGAYGEVWGAVDRKTGRRVAIKFYTHRGGLDWSLLSREVEKLRLLFADRYAVQLLDVGLEAEPPYYVMEYLENGSLEDRLQAGPMVPTEAVALFREIAVGLVHAHQKGVLHCDLKPANVLLDQDGKPRLADFGQARLAHEQSPALGTLYYMAPEQADLKAVPDAAWDVYALGALLYRMIVGRPPFRSPAIDSALELEADLEARLARYRQSIVQSGRPAGHRQVPGVDRSLAEIIDRSLSVDPNRRYPNVQAVLDALDARVVRNARRPLLVMGLLAPALLLGVSTLFAWKAYQTAVFDTNQAVTRRALESNQFAARFAAREAANEIQKYFREVEEFSRDGVLLQELSRLADDENVQQQLAALNEPGLGQEEFRTRQREFIADPARLALSQWLSRLARTEGNPEAFSWAILDAKGHQLARETTVEVADIATVVGKNLAYRTYFHGEAADRPRDGDLLSIPPIRQTHLSAAFRGQASNRLLVSVSTPVVQGEPESRLLGLLVLNVEIGKFVPLVESTGTRDRYAVLVQMRPGEDRGLFVQHPLFADILEKSPTVGLPDRFENDLQLRIPREQLPDVHERQVRYEDPLARDPEGAAYSGRWLAAMERVVVRSRRPGEQVQSVDTGLIMIVQENYDAAISPVHDLASQLLSRGLQAVAAIMAVITGLWGFVMLVLNESPRSRFLAALRRGVGLPTETLPPTGTTGSLGTARRFGRRGTPAAPDAGTSAKSETSADRPEAKG